MAAALPPTMTPAVAVSAQEMGSADYWRKLVPFLTIAADRQKMGTAERERWRAERAEKIKAKKEERAGKSYAAKPDVFRDRITEHGYCVVEPEETVTGEEVINTPFCPLQEKFHTFVLRGLRNVSVSP
jgi:hypothetical protein